VVYGRAHNMFDAMPDSVFLLVKFILCTRNFFSGLTACTKKGHILQFSSDDHNSRFSLGFEDL
jgi:hypothetical protein